jgi:hypothetical protein
MSTAVRTVESIWNPASGQDEWLAIESLSDDCSGAGIGAAILEITDSTEPIVHSICGRDRRLRIR